MTTVIMPKMGDGMEEGTLVEWLKNEGEAVKSGEVVANIQTDKATLEMEAPGTGTLAGVLLKAGGTVPVGVPIALILAPGETVPADWGSGNASAGSAAVAEPPIQPQDSFPKENRVEAPASATGGRASGAPAPAAPVAPDAPTNSTGGEANLEARPDGEIPVHDATPVVPHDDGSANGGRVKASPLARKIAAQQGVELAALAGTGPGGRIVAADVEGYKPAPASQPAPATPASQAPPMAASAEDRVVKLGKIRQITAKRTQESKSQVPHFYVTVEVDLERILSLREQFEEEASGKVSINDFVVKASALALRDMPEVNAVFQGDSLLVKGGVHVGIAVALPDGLTVPVVKNADAKGLRAISAEVKDLARRAKENKLSMDELSGSTFAISNMGMLDVDNFLAIINQPNSAILAIASARKKVVANDEGEIEVRTRMNVTTSFDHRVLDGAIGAKFSNVVKTYLENPTRLLS